MKAVKLFQNLIILALSFYPYQHGYLTKKVPLKFPSLIIREWLSLWWLYKEEQLEKALKLYMPIKSDTVQITVWFAKGINYKESFYFQLDHLFLREVSVIVTDFTF